MIALILALLLIAASSHADIRQSKYLETIPAYDCSLASPDLPTAQASGKYVIDEASDFDNINDSQITLFCVKPGDYTAVRGKDTITASGANGNPRIMALWNDDPEKDALHPGMLSWSDVASVGLVLDDADYWVFDRMGFNGKDQFTAPMWDFDWGASNNIINRGRFESMDRGIRMRHLSHNNTIQNTRMGEMSHAGRAADRVCVELITIDNDMVSKGYPSLTTVEVHNFKLLSSELWNCNDAFQAVRHPADTQPTDYRGTIIDANMMWSDESMRTDCNGVYTPSGVCGMTENAVDLKAGSPVAGEGSEFLVSNNIMWGWRKTDPIAHTSNADGAAISTHNGTLNTRIIGNIVADSGNGLICAAPPDASISDYSCADFQFTHNIIANTVQHAGYTSSTGRGLHIKDTNNFTAAHNIFIGAASEWLKQGHNGQPENDNPGAVLNCNVAISSAAAYFYTDGPDSIDSNVLYSTTDSWGAGHNTVERAGTPTVAHDLVFTYDNYTNSPQLLVIADGSVWLTGDDAMPAACSSGIPAETPDAPGAP